MRPDLPSRDRGSLPEQGAAGPGHQGTAAPSAPFFRMAIGLRRCRMPSRSAERAPARAPGQRSRCEGVWRRSVGFRRQASETVEFWCRLRSYLARKSKVLVQMKGASLCKSLKIKDFSSESMPSYLLSLLQKSAPNRRFFKRMEVAWVPLQPLLRARSRYGGGLHGSAQQPHAPCSQRRIAPSSAHEPSLAAGCADLLSTLGRGVQLSRGHRVLVQTRLISSRKIQSFGANEGCQPL